jgi:hypothetical protein
MIIKWSEWLGLGIPCSLAAYVEVDEHCATCGSLYVRMGMRTWSHFLSSNVLEICLHLDRTCRKDASMLLLSRVCHNNRVDRTPDSTQHNTKQQHNPNQNVRYQVQMPSLVVRLKVWYVYIALRYRELLIFRQSYRNSTSFGLAHAQHG